MVSELSGYSSQESLTCKIVNGATKATIQGRAEPVIFVVNYASLLEDPNEEESLLCPYQSMAHGVKYDLTPKMYGGTGCISLNDRSIPYEFDEEKPFFRISKPTEDDLDNLEVIELANSINATTTH